MQYSLELVLIVGILWEMPVEIDFVVKLGGSAITNKDVVETLNADTLSAAAEVLAECFRLGLRFIVAHGAG